MILKALYDYYQRSGNLPAFGTEEKQIGFLIVIDRDGNFIRFEDCRLDKSSARTYIVKKSVSRSSAPVANFLYDNSSYVFGYASVSSPKDQTCFDTFKAKVESIASQFRDDQDMVALVKFYESSRESIIECMKKDPLWEEITRNLSKKFSNFSFRIEGDLEILAQKKKFLSATTASMATTDQSGQAICLVSGKYCVPVKTTTATMIPGSQATAKLVAFQVKSGYDPFGKEQGMNAPISEEAEFAYTTALNAMLASGSRNKFSIGNRTFVFWASGKDEASQKAEESLFDLLGFTDNVDDPNARIDRVRKVFDSIYTGKLHTASDDKFYILGLAPNSARIAVVFWQETRLKDFAGTILRHFHDMEIGSVNPVHCTYMGLRDILGAVTLGGKHSDAAPNLPDAVVRSIFLGYPYPNALFSADIRRIRAEQDVDPYRNPCRVAILKAYLNRINDNNIKIKTMLDKENTNVGYLCGRLFAVLDKIQEDANNTRSIKERYLNSASSTPSSVFSTIMNLSSHHTEKLSEASRIYYEKIEQEIIGMLPSNGFPAHLNLNDQGRFFVGFYQQRQELFTKKNN